MLRTLALLMLVSVTLAPVAMAAPDGPDLPPLVGACALDSCGEGTLVCVGFSRQIPTCVDAPVWD